jgi:PAS domain S-box-containing protein
MDFSEYRLEPLRKDGEFVLYRGLPQTRAETSPRSILALSPITEHPAPATVKKIEYEFSLKGHLDPAWAIRPITLTQQQSRTILWFEDPDAEPLDRLAGSPLELRQFLRFGIALAASIGHLHRRGLIHKDIKPRNVFANATMDQAWLTGFGIASRLPRERRAAEPPELIAGTLAYMAPEQTGRMNRSVDTRSDLYAFGVTLYELLTGSLPFSASDPMEWVHCHIARQPLPPAERLRSIPHCVSAIIVKLLAKAPEERYQTAIGVERDLRRCLEDMDRERGVHDFALGDHDRPDYLQIPEKLYGREREIETLLTAFDRIVSGGVPELVLVSGYSGIGKTSVVNELQPVLVAPRGLFASGKFDQYKRDIPYSTLAQAFQSLIRPLLTKSETELGKWRHDLREALDQNGQLIVDLVPELKLIIGEQPPVPEVPPRDAQRRFQLVIRRFIAVFARQEHPLALFLDDLQWLDAATLDLLEDLLTRSEPQHLMLIGAYRDNEVDAAHPLMRKLEAIKSAGGKVREITLAPLTQRHLGQLLADALCCEPGRSAPLAQIVQEKTGGNPFFTIQFFSSLTDEQILAFDHDAACWSWDLERIHAKGFTNNVVDLMTAKLVRLPAETQTALQQLACIGNLGEITALSIVLETTPKLVHAALWESVRQGLVEQLDGSYKFIHDRVQEAAYSLIPEASRAEANLRIGRLLAAHTSPDKREETVFDIVNHLNRGVALITSQEERENLAELNLIAGKRAKASTAYASALNYLVAGAALLGDDCWERRRDLIFALELERAECEFLTGEVEAADERSTALSSRAANTIERAAVAFLKLDVCTVLLQLDRAVAVALEYLRHVGIECSPHPTEDEVRREYEQIWSRLGGRTIEDVTDLPLMSDPESLATVGVLTKMMVPAYLTDRNLDCLTNCRAVNLSLERGNCDASCLAYVMLGRLAVQRFGDYKTGFRFGQVGCELVEGRGLKRFQAGTYLYLAAVIAPWMKHVRTSTDLQRRAFDAANKLGDLSCANYANIALNSGLLVAGNPLSDVQREAELALAAAQQARFSSNVDVVITQLALVRTLRGLTPKFGCFDSEELEELPFERHLADNPYLEMPECWYWVRKMQARYFAGDHAAAIEASSKAQRLLQITSGWIEEAECHFYSALSRAAFCDTVTAAERVLHLEPLAQHLRKLEIWAENCPDNFENRAALVGAEIARIESRDLDAMRLYEKAVHSSRTNGFVNNEALAYERASAFYRARGFDQFADTYMRNARACYATWGADGKVRQLDELHPHLTQYDGRSDPTRTVEAPVEQLDLSAVLKVLQAVSGETDLEKLIGTVMRLSLEHAGAERGLLLLPQGSGYRVGAEASMGNDGITVALRDSSVTAEQLPESAFHYVLRTREAVLLHDASAENAFSGDPYIRQRRPRSVLCMPLIKQTRLVGFLYLENSLTSGVFSPARMTLLKLLASEAAISIENARLYRDLQEREARVRRLIEANIIGIFIWHVDGRVVDANEELLRIIGYSREDVVSGRLRWPDFSLAERREHDLRLLEELRAGGGLKAEESELLRKDGTRVPVLAGATMFEGGADDGVAFVVDLTELKRAEQALHESEREARLIVETIPGLVAILTPAGKVDAVNRQLVDYCGQPLEAMRDWGTNGTIHSEDLPRVVQVFTHSIASGDPYDFEARIRRFDGAYRWFQVRGLPLHDTSGQIVRWYVLLSDIDDRKRAESDLRDVHERFVDAQRLAALSTLTASIAHEVNQPLTGIITNASTCFRMLNADPPNIDGARETTRRTIRDGQRASEVITRLRAMFSKKEFMVESVDLNEAMREVVALSMNDLKRNRVVLQVELAERLPIIMGDRIQLQQVILNLLRNASEAMAEVNDHPRQLVLRTETDSEAGIRLIVRDTGVGLDHQSLDKLFEAFYTTKQGGMGIGLSVSRSIIERHQGRIWAEPNDGPGATFGFSIPVGGSIKKSD